MYTATTPSLIHVQLYDITLIIVLLHDRLRKRKIESVNQKLFLHFYVASLFSILYATEKNLDCGVGGTLRRYILSVF